MDNLKYFSKYTFIALKRALFFERPLYLCNFTYFFVGNLDNILQKLVSFRKFPDLDQNSMTFTGQPKCPDFSRFSKKWQSCKIYINL